MEAEIKKNITQSSYREWKDGHTVKGEWTFQKVLENVHWKRCGYRDMTKKRIRVDSGNGKLSEVGELKSNVVCQTFVYSESAVATATTTMTRKSDGISGGDRSTLSGHRCEAQPTDDQYSQKRSLMCKQLFATSSES